MATIVGIEVCANTVRGIAVDPAAGRIVRAAEEAVPAAGVEAGTSALEQALRRLRARLRVGGAPVAVTTDVGTVISRVSLPFSDPRRVAEVAAFQMEERLPFEVTGWAIDQTVARELEEGVELLVFGARRRDVEELMEALLGAGLYAAAVVPRAAALLALVARDGSAAPRAVVWVDASEADIVVGTNAGPRLARAVPLPDETAEGPDDAAEAAAREVGIALLAAGTEAGGCPTYVGGRDGAAERVLEVLASAPGSSAQPLDVLMPLASPDRGAGGAAAWAPAAGAALSLSSGWRPDLARGMRGPALVLRSASGAVTAFLVAAVLVGGLFLALQVHGAVAGGRALREAQDAVRSVWNALYPQEAMPPDPRQRVLSDLAAATGQREGGPESVDALARLRTAIEALPQDSALKVVGFRVVAGTLVLRCTAGSLAAADRAVAALQGALKAPVTARNPTSLGSGEHAFDLVVRRASPGEGGADE